MHSVAGEMRTITHSNRPPRVANNLIIEELQVISKASAVARVLTELVVTDQSLLMWF